MNMLPQALKKKNIVGNKLKQEKREYKRKALMPKFFNNESFVEIAVAKSCQIVSRARGKQAAHCKLHCPAPHYPMQIRISQISCSAAGHFAIAAINNAPCYKYEPGAEPFSPPTKYTGRTLLCTIPRKHSPRSALHSTR